MSIRRFLVDSRRSMRFFSHLFIFLYFYDHIFLLQWIELAIRAVGLRCFPAAFDLAKLFANLIFGLFDEGSELLS